MRYTPAMPSSTSQTSGPSTLIIHNGGYGALLASLMAESEADSHESEGRGRGFVYAWIPPVGTGLFSDEPPYVEGAISARNRAEMVARQAKLMGFREVFAEDPAVRRSRSGVGAMLLRALELAKDNRCELVVWPISVGGNLEFVHRVVEQAALASDLAALDDNLDGNREFGPVRIMTPLADLAQVDLDRLAEDLSAPLEACWKPVCSPSAPL